MSSILQILLIGLSLGYDSHFPSRHQYNSDWTAVKWNSKGALWTKGFKCRCENQLIQVYFIFQINSSTFLELGLLATLCIYSHVELGTHRKATNGFSSILSQSPGPETACWTPATRPWLSPGASSAKQCFPSLMLSLASLKEPRSVLPKDFSLSGLLSPFIL